jgi:hypothetical protein
MTELSRTQALNAANGAALKRLKEAHTDEFNGYMAEEAKARGQEWSPRLTPEQRAEQELQDLLAKFPDLANKVKAD